MKVEERKGLMLERVEEREAHGGEEETDGGGEGGDGSSDEDFQRCHSSFTLTIALHSLNFPLFASEKLALAA